MKCEQEVGIKSVDTWKKKKARFRMGIQIPRTKIRVLLGIFQTPVFFPKRTKIFKNQNSFEHTNFFHQSIHSFQLHQTWEP